MSGLGFVLGVVAVAALAIAIGLRAFGLSWREALVLVGQGLCGAFVLWALVVLFAALGARDL